MRHGCLRGLKKKKFQAGRIIENGGSRLICICIAALILIYLHVSYRPPNFIDVLYWTSATAAPLNNAENIRPASNTGSYWNWKFGILKALANTNWDVFNLGLFPLQFFAFCVYIQKPEWSLSFNRFSRRCISYLCLHLITLLHLQIYGLKCSLFSPKADSVTQQTDSTDHTGVCQWNSIRCSVITPQARRTHTSQSRTEACHWAILSMFSSLLFLSLICWVTLRITASAAATYR